MAEAEAMWWTADGSRKRKNPVCKECHELAVRGSVRGMVARRNDQRPQESKENVRDTKYGIDR